MAATNQVEVVEKIDFDENIQQFSVEPDFASFPSSIFSEAKFCEKKDHLLVQIKLHDISLDQVKITASGKSLILRVNRVQGSNFIRIISLPLLVNIDQAKAEMEKDVLTIYFPISPTSKEIEINKI